MYINKEHMIMHHIDSDFYTMKSVSNNNSYALTGLILDKRVSFLEKTFYILRKYDTVFCTNV